MDDDPFHRLGREDATQLSSIHAFNDAMFLVVLPHECVCVITAGDLAFVGSRLRKGNVRYGFYGIIARCLGQYGFFWNLNFVGLTGRFHISAFLGKSSSTCGNTGRYLRCHDNVRHSCNHMNQNCHNSIRSAKLFRAAMVSLRSHEFHWNGRKMNMYCLHAR